MKGENAKIMRKRPRMEREYVPVFASVCLIFIVELKPWNEKYTMINCVTIVLNPKTNIKRTWG